jgi:hypothetical protein
MSRVRYERRNGDGTPADIEGLVLEKTLQYGGTENVPRSRARQYMSEAREDSGIWHVFNGIEFRYKTPIFLQKQAD